MIPTSLSLYDLLPVRTDKGACKAADGRPTDRVVCDYVVEELRLVTDRKFPAKLKFLDHFFLELSFEPVYTPKVLDLSEFSEMRNTKDSPILATAIMEVVDVFVTGDKDFLVLEMDMPEIVTMAEFLER